MTTLYVYDADSLEVVQIVNGTQEQCDEYANNIIDTDTKLGTYTPAFGFNGGLVERTDAEIIDL